jgi:large subunit ribosomal protein L22
MTTTPAETPEVRAVAKWVRISPRKARLVVDHIRGRSVPEARTVLAFTTRAAAREIEKVLRSAVANAEANHGLVGDRLVVSGAHVDDGLIIKRWKPRARGRVARIRKRTCHITIKLAPMNGAAAPVAAPPPLPAPAEEPEPETPVTEPEETAPAAEEPAAEDQAAEEQAAEEQAAEEQRAEKPKPLRRRRRSEPKAEKPEAPKKRRTRKKKEEEN